MAGAVIWELTALAKTGKTRDEELESRYKLPRLPEVGNTYTTDDQRTGRSDINRLAMQDYYASGTKLYRNGTTSQMAPL